MKTKVVKAVNEQINMELESAYLYLAMSARMETLNLPGLARWLRVQWDEEIVHAMKLFDFLIQRDEKVALKAISQPRVSYRTPLAAFEQVLEHEQQVTASISSLFELAVAEKDHALQSLLQWFIDEQVEEEDNARAAIDSLRLVGNTGSGLYIFDKEMGRRQDVQAEAGGGA